MLSIDLLAFGRIKSKALRSLCDDYIQRSRSFLQIRENELKPKSGLALHQTRATEEEMVFSALPKNQPLFALDERGASLTSLDFHRLLFSHSRATIVIGSSYGLGERLLSKARVISFGAQTLPHELARLVLFEQLYRAGTIEIGHPYHHAD